MKVILLFDNGLNGLYRVYELSRENDKKLREGCVLTMAFKHPFHDEYIHINSTEPSKEKK